MPQDDYKFTVQSDGITFEINASKEHKGEFAVTVTIPARTTITNLSGLIKMIKALNYFKSQQTDNEG